MPLDESGKCSNCGNVTASDASHCANCGEAVSVSPRSYNALAVTGLILLGIVSALPVVFALGGLGLTLLSSFGYRAGEYVPSWGATAFFVVITLLTIVGLVAQSRVRLRAELRAFVVAFLVTSLGLFAICDIIAVSSGA